MFMWSPMCGLQPISPATPRSRPCHWVQAKVACMAERQAFNMGGLGISSDSRQGQNNFGQKNFKNYFQRTQRRSNICPKLGTSWMGDQLNGSSITWWSSWMGDQLTYGDVIFDLEPSAFKKYSTCWVFQALCNFCIFVFAYYWIE